MGSAFNHSTNGLSRYNKGSDSVSMSYNFDDSKKNLSFPVLTIK